jgi:hypothetical protein
MVEWIDRSQAREMKNEQARELPDRLDACT